MKLNDAILIPAQVAAKFEDDDLDWLIGELNHAMDEATACGSLLYRWDPGLARSALDFFRRYYERLEFKGPKIDFDAVRMSDEEWDRRFREKIRKICGGLPLNPVEPPCSAK